MGLGSFLFYIEFEREIEEKTLDELLISIGLKQIKKDGENLTDFRSYYYELITNNGIIEAHSLFSLQKDSVQKFSLRFSVFSPTEVIDQTFELLTKLNNKKPIKVIYNHSYMLIKQEGKEDVIRDQSHIPINAEAFKKRIGRE